MTTGIAHDREYLAAISGMPEHTISPRRSLDGFAIGDSIAFRLTGWSESSCATGRICDVHERRNTLLVETDNDIVEVDPRPWPVGNVLPF